MNGDGRLGLHIRIYGDNTSLIFESKWAMTLEQGTQESRL